MDMELVAVKPDMEEEWCWLKLMATVLSKYKTVHYNLKVSAMSSLILYC